MQLESVYLRESGGPPVVVFFFICVSQPNPTAQGRGADAKPPTLALAVVKAAKGRSALPTGRENAILLLLQARCGGGGGR